MEKLKVGDKVVYINSGFGSTSYIFSKVVRLTNTLAILDNGDRLKNTPEKAFYNNDDFCFLEYGNGYSVYVLSTPQIEKECEDQKHIKKTNIWFKNKKFTDQEIEKIYNLFNK